MLLHPQLFYAAPSFDAYLQLWPAAVKPASAVCRCQLVHHVLLCSAVH